LSVADNTPTRQRLKWLRRQQEIIDGAARVFRAKGYDGTSMDDIAEAVGLLKGSLYHYINSKEELLYWIARSVDSTTVATMERTARAEEPAVERLRDHMMRHIAFEGAGFETAVIKIQVYYREFRSLSVEHQEEVAAGRRHYEAYTRTLLEDARQEGAVCPTLDLDVMTPAILSMLNSVILAYRPGRAVAWPHVAETYADFVLQGLTCPPSHVHEAPPSPRPAARRRPRRSPAES
jgi:TetR/AcrR family transcriptional regulator, cholesterol catabolism regulator